MSFFCNVTNQSSRARWGQVRRFSNFCFCQVVKSPNGVHMHHSFWSWSLSFFFIASKSNKTPLKCNVTNRGNALLVISLAAEFWMYCILLKSVSGIPYSRPLIVSKWQVINAWTSFSVVPLSLEVFSNFANFMKSHGCRFTLIADMILHVKSTVKNDSKIPCPGDWFSGWVRNIYDRQRWRISKGRLHVITSEHGGLQKWRYRNK